MKQGTTLTPRASFTFKANGKGRAIVFKTGDRFWITSPAYQNFESAIVGRPYHHINQGYKFTIKQIEELFQAETAL